MLSYLGLKFQIKQSLGRNRNTGQQRLYEFCYLRPFDLWTSYLARILFLKRGGLFNVFPNLERKVIKSAINEEICFLICPS